MYTYSGRQFDPFHPDPSLIDIGDIAHALSNVCRYGGHSSFFYSVAQHSVLMANEAPESLRKAALLHDAAEAYLGDLPRPLKSLEWFGSVYCEAEALLLGVVMERFGVTWSREVQLAIEYYDQYMLSWEQRDVMPQTMGDGPWFDMFDPPNLVIVSWTPQIARDQYLSMFRQLFDAPVAA